MTISFKSKEEIATIAELLTAAYPSDIIIDIDPDEITVTPSDKTKALRLDAGYSEPERPRPRMSSSEIHAYLAGEQEALYNLVRIGKLSLFDVSRFLSKPHVEVSRGYDIWFAENGHREMWPTE